MFNKNQINEPKDSMLNKAQDVKEQAKMSTIDWRKYIMEHPVQSLFFGAVIGLAIKGLFK